MSATAKGPGIGYHDSDSPEAEKGMGWYVRMPDGRLWPWPYSSPEECAKSLRMYAGSGVENALKRVAAAQAELREAGAEAKRIAACVRRDLAAIRARRRRG